MQVAWTIEFTSARVVTPQRSDLGFNGACRHRGLLDVVSRLIKNFSGDRRKQDRESRQRTQMESALTTDRNAGGNELNTIPGKCHRSLALSGFLVVFIMPFGSARAANYPMDINGYCKSIGRSGVTNSNNTGYGWHCQPGNMDIVAQNVCNWQYGSGSGLAARLLSPPPGRPNDWVCQGQLPTAPPAPPGPGYSSAGREIHVTFCYAAGGMDAHWRLTVRDRLTQRPIAQEMTPGACMTVGLMASDAGYGNVTISGHGPDYDISLLGDGEKMDLY